MFKSSDGTVIYEGFEDWTKEELIWYAAHATEILHLISENCVDANKVYGSSDISIKKIREHLIKMPVFDSCVNADMLNAQIKAFPAPDYFLRQIMSVKEIQQFLDNIGFTNEPVNNEEHVDEFCKQFAAIWKQHPDLRFGQLISIICSTRYIYDMKGRDIFYIEDEDMLDYIEDYFDGSN